MNRFIPCSGAPCTLELFGILFWYFLKGQFLHKSKEGVAEWRGGLCDLLTDFLTGDWLTDLPITLKDRTNERIDGWMDRWNTNSCENSHHWVAVSHVTCIMREVHSFPSPPPCTDIPGRFVRPQKTSEPCRMQDFCSFEMLLFMGSRNRRVWLYH